MRTFLTFFRRLFYLFISILFLAFVLFLLYYLPSTKKAYLIGTEIKRELIQMPKGDTFKDVRYIVARDFDTGKTLMFRNEDNPWPPYFKFNSGDLSGEVMNIQQSSPKKVVNITYYGFRIPMLSQYPNATQFEIVSENYRHTPWFNIIFLGSFALLFFFIFFKIKRRGSKKIKSLEDKKVPLPAD